jgi:hypothetical protein
MTAWTSDPLPLPADPDAPFKRVDLEFQEVRHDGASFVVLVYLNNPEASEATGRDESQGFAAGFTVFAHGSCWGDAGHCDVRSSRANAFDRRAEHRLAPLDVTLDVTDAVHALGSVRKLTVTTVAFPAAGAKPAERSQPTEKILRFSSLRLVTYE